MCCLTKFKLILFDFDSLILFFFYIKRWPEKARGYGICWV